MAAQVLIPYQFTQDSFKETCQKIHFFGTEKHEFVISHQIAVQKENTLLISVKDLLKKKTENKLEAIISKLKSCHPEENINAKSLAFEGIDIHTIREHKIDHLAFEINQLNQASKTSTILAQIPASERPYQYYFHNAFWQKTAINLLWIEKDEHVFRYNSHNIPLQSSFPLPQNSFLNASKSILSSLSELDKMQNAYDLIILKV